LLTEKKMILTPAPLRVARAAVYTEKARNERILHVHCAVDPVWIITAYDPTLNPDEWDPDFKKRRKEK